MSPTARIKAAKAYDLRTKGMIFREIGKAIGINCPSRVANLVRAHERELDYLSKGGVPLSVRAANCLHNASIEATKESIIAAVKSGRLDPRNHRKGHRIRNHGWKSYKEICLAVGLPDPTPGKRTHCCPNCGFRLSGGKGDA